MNGWKERTLNGNKNPKSYESKKESAFHLSTLVRRRRNLIIEIKEENGL